MDNKIKMQAKNVDFFYGKTQALKNVSLDVYANQVTAMIGPSGCGKSTFIRLFNRMNELVLHTTLNGEIFLDDLEINSPLVDAVDIRRRVGMVFQKPNPFPKSIFENISYGLRVNGIKDRAFIEHKVEDSLKKAVIWGEVKDRLNDSALKLSGGQQQRLCIARCLAVETEVILFDEPCA
ncbi:MAG: ATP-binding cassette domain-containing protein, partial [Candidatus Omnitrophica bacterium]|nr:ATP-binding cassette domain-containing protein [Candidatus Omnitrophota bacterium]